MGVRRIVAAAGLPAAAAPFPARSFVAVALFPALSALRVERRLPSLETPMSQTLHPMLNIAVKAARAAGAVINRASLDIDKVQVESKGVNDFVTEVDKHAEAVIVDTLLAAYPGHGILAEESGREMGAKDSEFLWII